MLVKNFHNANLEVSNALGNGQGGLVAEIQNDDKVAIASNRPSDKSSIDIQRLEEAIEYKYKLPKRFQRIVEISRNPFLSLNRVPRHGLVSERTVPEHFVSMGVSQGDYDYFCANSATPEMVEQCLFPYVYAKEKGLSPGVRFDDASLVDIDGYIESLPSSQKDVILSNVEYNIGSFLEDQN